MSAFGGLFSVALGTSELVFRGEAGLLSSHAAPDSPLLAEVRHMPESSELPYGTGVFLRSRWAVSHKYQSTLAFAGYCNGLTVNWQNAQSLQVACTLSEKQPYIPESPVRGVNVEVRIVTAQRWQ